MPDREMPNTEDELIAAALALVDAKKGLERVRVRQSATPEILKAEDRIAPARVRLERAAEAYYAARQNRCTGDARLPEPLTTRTEAELLAAAVALVEVRKGLEQLRVRQAGIREQQTAKQPAGLEPVSASASALTDLRRAEDKIAAARARLESAVKVHVDARRNRAPMR